MRTVDVLVAGLFSPAVVAAVGVGDSFGRILNRIGGGLGDSTIALSSQDTGVGALKNRDEALSQAFIIGVLLGIPFAIFGPLLSSSLIALLGAEPDVIRMGGQYLALIMINAPMNHLSRVGAKALQGTGDTVTPMYIRGFGNILNIVGTTVLALGIGPFPSLSVIGIGLGTLLGETVTALSFLGVIYRSQSLQLIRPSNWTVTKQLVMISLPHFAEGGGLMIADIPFNAVLLAISTEATAAYHIGRRIYRQFLGPIRIGFDVAGNILVGQSLGNDVSTAYTNGITITSLSIGITGLLGFVLFFGSSVLVQWFTDDPATATAAIMFVQVFAIAGVFQASFSGLRGALRGGSDTRTPFIATLVGMFVFLMGVSYVGGIYLGYGILGVFVAIILDFAWRAGFLGIVYYRRNWITHGIELMEDRGSENLNVD